MIADLNAEKARLSTENCELNRVLEERESMQSQLIRGKNSLQQQNDELKRTVEEESKAKAALAHSVQAAKHDIDLLRIGFESLASKNYVIKPSVPSNLIRV